MKRESKRFYSDFAKMDATPGVPVDEIPEVTQKMVNRGVCAVSGVIFRGPSRPGRPWGNRKKQAIRIELDKDLVDLFKRGGKGWQTRINGALRVYVELSTRTFGFPEMYDAVVHGKMPERIQRAKTPRTAKVRRAN